MQERTQAPAAGRRIPRPALLLAAAGVLPFAAGAAGSWLADPARVAFALNAMLGYAAVILSFLGAVHWGRALAPDEAARPPTGWLLWAVAPALLGWAAMFVGAVVPALGLFVAAFAAAVFVDLRAVRAGRLPAWYGRLRKGVTVAVLAALFVALMGAVDAARL